MWKTIIIDNQETNYEINNIGEVRNKKTNKILKQQIQNGYCHCTLAINKKPKRCRIHRLVAQTFIDNPEQKEYVNHKDGNRQNNNVENLEGVTPSENAQHAIAAGLKTKQGRKRPVIQYSMDGAQMMVFNSLTDAERQTGVQQSKITLACQRQRRSAGDYQGRYADDVQDVVAIEKKGFAGKKVAQCDEDFNIINIYNSYNEAARAVNGSSSAISRICSGTNQRHKGYRGKLVEEIVQDI